MAISGSQDHAAGTSALPPTCDMMAMLKVARPPIDDRATASVVKIFDAQSATRGFAQVCRGTQPQAFARPDAQWLAGPRIAPHASRTFGDPERTQARNRNAPVLAYLLYACLEFTHDKIDHAPRLGLGHSSLLGDFFDKFGLLHYLVPFVPSVYNI